MKDNSSLNVGDVGHSVIKKALQTNLDMAKNLSISNWFAGMSRPTRCGDHSEWLTLYEFSVL